MPPHYSTLRDRVATSVDRRLGETLLFRPSKDGRRDASRDELAVIGVLRTDDQKPGPMTGGDRGGKARVLADGSAARLALSVADYAVLEILEGDELRALDRQGQPWFEVLHVDRRHHSRIYIYLGDGGR